MEYIFLAPPLIFALLFIGLLIFGAIIGIAMLGLKNYGKLTGPRRNSFNGVKTWLTWSNFWVFPVRPQMKTQIKREGAVHQAESLKLDWTSDASSFDAMNMTINPVIRIVEKRKPWICPQP